MYICFSFDIATSKLFQIICITILLQMFSTVNHYSYANVTYENNLEVDNGTSEVRNLRRVALVDDQPIVFRVVNGRPARIGEVPYQVALMQRVGKSRYSTTCGGSIIGPRKILTAAHCITTGRGRRRSLFGLFGRSKRSVILPKGRFYNKRVVAGQLRTTATYGLEGQWRRIDSGRFPNTYHFPKDDIAVLILNKKFKFNDAVQPIPYAKKNIDYHQQCVVSGYGNTRWSRNKRKSIGRSAFLRIARLKTLRRMRCRLIHRRHEGRYNRQDWNKFICTSDATSDTNKGDSGGPLVCKGTGDPAENKIGVLVGIVSGKKMIRLGTFFTRVSRFTRFINGCARFVASTWYLLFNLFYCYLLSSYLILI